MLKTCTSSFVDDVEDEKLILAVGISMSLGPVKRVLQKKFGKKYCIVKGC